MANLKSRQKFIPNGFKFYQPETKWSAPAYSSFDVIVDALISHRRSQPYLAQKHGWSLEREAVADEVDQFNARICEQMGWNDYVQSPLGAAPPPKFPAPSPVEQGRLAAVAGHLRKIWAGVRTLNDWIDSGEPAVAPELSARRASDCASCNKNTPGDFTRWFTQPAAEAIKRQMSKLSERKLSTPMDDRINVCNVCLCPLKLKVHTPLKFINAQLSEEVFAELSAAPDCWIVRERKE